MKSIKTLLAGLSLKSNRDNSRELDKTKSIPAITEEERQQYLRAMLPTTNEYYTYLSQWPFPRLK